MAKQPVAVELFYNSAWNAAETYTRDGIATRRGLADESLEVEPGQAGLSLDNRDGSKNPANPLSPLYGLIGRNTPIRVSVGGDVRLSGEVADWMPRRSLEPVDIEKGRGDAWTVTEGAGILRRLGQGNTPLRSPAYRAIVAEDPHVYWPLEDGSEATEATSGLPGGSPMVPSGSVGFGQGKGLPGSPAIVGTSSSPGKLTGTVPAAVSSTWMVEWVARFEGTFGGTTRQFISWRMTGTWRLWDVGADGVDWFIVPTDAAGAGGGSTATGDNVYDGELHNYRVHLTQINPTQIGVDLVMDGVVTGAGTYSGTLGDITEVIVNPLQQSGADCPSIGHVLVHHTPPFSPDNAARLGHVGEKAGFRFERLCTEEGVPKQLFGTASETQPMGVQAADTFVELLQECARTDAGVLYEFRTILGVVLRTGRDLTNVDPVLTLDYAAGEVAHPLEPTIGDKLTRNDVTAARRFGGSHRAVLETGRLSILAPPNGVGRYDTQLDVNTSTDAVLPDHAGWHLHKGTVDEVRYRQVTVDLSDALPALVTAVNAVNIGDRIRVNNLPREDTPDPALLMVIAVSEAIGSHTRRVTFLTVPASPYEVGVVGAADGSVNLRGQAVDTDLSTLASGVTAVATSLSVASTGGVLWTTDSSDWNAALHGGGLYIRIGGEDMRITNITGAASPQTFTVERSANGVKKAHLAGAPVHVRYPIVVGL